MTQAQLITYIETYINTNGVYDITGAEMQDVLETIVNTIYEEFTVTPAGEVPLNMKGHINFGYEGALTIAVGDVYVNDDIDGEVPAGTYVGDWIVCRDAGASLDEITPGETNAIWYYFPFGLPGVDAADIRDALETLSGNNRLNKSAVRGANYALNYRGSGDVYDPTFRNGMTNILPGDYWIYDSGIASPTDPASDTSGINQGDYIVAVKADPSLSNFGDEAEWAIIRIGKHTPIQVTVGTSTKLANVGSDKVLLYATALTEIQSFGDGVPGDRKTIINVAATGLIKLKQSAYNSTGIYIPGVVGNLPLVIYTCLEAICYGTNKWLVINVAVPTSSGPKGSLTGTIELEFWRDEFYSKDSVTGDIYFDLKDISDPELGAFKDGATTMYVCENDGIRAMTYSSKIILVSGIWDSRDAAVNKLTFIYSNDADLVFLTIHNERIYSDSKKYHGIETMGARSFNNSTHVLTVAEATNTYWYQGEQYITTSAITCDLDSFETLTANTLYYFYFDDASGTLKCADSFWNLKTMVPVAMVFWNGSAGAIIPENHNHTRDIDFHILMHLTVGCRYYSGLSLTYPTAANDASLQIESGTIYDEDAAITIAQCTTMRGFYKASANVYTFADYALPYLGASGDPYWLDTDDYTLKSVGDTDFVVYWVYATGDQDRPIWITCTHAATAHNTIALARAEAIPALSGLNLSPEMKLIYKFIYKGDGQFQEYSDYRYSQPLPSGGTPSTTAGSVSFVPTGNIASTTVQTAIEEVDSEKASLTGTETLTNKRITRRIDGTTSSATPTINTDNVDEYQLTAQAEDITSFTTNLSGTPTNGQKLIISITGTGARAITWGSSFESSTVTLPTTTVSTNRLDVGFEWNTVTSKWRCIAKA